MSAEHRRTAEEWHGGQSSPLYAYASTGTVVAGIDREILACLALVETGESSRGLDTVVEHQRLRALLDHVKPELAAGRAREIGREHGEEAAARWQQHALGGRAAGDTAGVARHVLRGIDDGDPAILDTLPAPGHGYTPAELTAECDWPEPDVDDRSAHDRWRTGQADVWDAYTTAFRDAVQDAVVGYCHDELAPTGLATAADTSPTTGGPGRPHDRLAAVRAASDATRTAHTTGPSARGLEL